MTLLDLLHACHDRRVVRHRGLGYTVDDAPCDTDTMLLIDRLLIDRLLDDGLLFVSRQRDINRALVRPSVRAYAIGAFTPVPA
jgi:hypothetical protein